MFGLKKSINLTSENLPFSRKKLCHFQNTKHFFHFKFWNVFFSVNSWLRSPSLSVLYFQNMGEKERERDMENRFKQFDVWYPRTLKLGERHFSARTTVGWIKLIFSVLRTLRTTERLVRAQGKRSISTENKTRPRGLTALRKTNYSSSSSSFRNLFETFSFYFDFQSKIFFKF